MWPWRVNIVFIGLRCTKIKMKKNILWTHQAHNERIKETITTTKNYTNISHPHTLLRSHSNSIWLISFSISILSCQHTTICSSDSISRCNAERDFHRSGQCDSIVLVNINLIFIPSHPLFIIACLSTTLSSFRRLVLLNMHLLKKKKIIPVSERVKLMNKLSYRSFGL